MTDEDFAVEEYVSLSEPFDLERFALAMTHFHQRIYARGDRVDLSFLIAAFTGSAIEASSNTTPYRAIFNSKGIDVDRIEAAVHTMLDALATSTD